MVLIPTLISLITPALIQYQQSIIYDMPVIEDKQETHYSSNKVKSNTYEVLTSWYGPGFHGETTASGETFNQYAMTAASPYLDFGTQLEVTYNGRSVIVTINDRGPYYGGRELDLSMAAADVLGIDGVAYVTVRELK